MRKLKWHIFNKNTNKPLTWDGRAIEFNREKDAIRFLNSCNENGAVIKDYVIQEAILYYDGGYINLSGFYIKDDMLIEESESEEYECLW